MIDRILPDLYRITLPMPFRLRHVHVYACCTMAGWPFSTRA